MNGKKLIEQVITKLMVDYLETTIDIKIEEETIMGEEYITAYYHSFKDHTIYKGMAQINKTTNESKFTHVIMH